MKNNPKDLQESSYDFPYHHLVGKDQDKGFHLHRYYHFGLDYWLNFSALLDEVVDLHFDSLLDAGCGDGKLIREAKQFFDFVTGIDISEKALNFARAFNPEVSFYSDWDNLDRKFGCVTALEVLEHVKPEKTDNFLRNVREHHKDSGRFLLTVPSDEFTTDKKHYRHFDPESLEKTLKPYYELNSIKFTVRLNLPYQLIRRLLVNRFWISNWSGFNSTLWNIAKAACQEADESSGKHLFAVAEPC
jgi:SAM-dependent methyltransferase